MSGSPARIRVDLAVLGFSHFIHEKSGNARPIMSAGSDARLDLWFGVLRRSSCENNQVRRPWLVSNR